MQMSPSGIVCHLSCKRRDSFKYIVLTFVVPLRFLFYVPSVMNVLFEDTGVTGYLNATSKEMVCSYYRALVSYMLRRNVSADNNNKKIENHHYTQKKSAL